eukprot:jgi/Ulvmu1/8161/UM040_0058.1
MFSADYRTAQPQLPTVVCEADKTFCSAPHVRYVGGREPTGECIGSGSYGVVQQCSFTTATGQQLNDVAVKSAIGKDAAELRAAEASLAAEAQVLCAVHTRCGCAASCRHIPPLLAVVPGTGNPPTTGTPRARALILPPYPTCLYKRLCEAKSAHKTAGCPAPILPMHERLRIILHVVRALKCAERARMAHCDIKPSNIMLDANGSAVLIDWGLATAHGEYCQGAFGTSAYVPPEMLDPAGFTACSSLDVWSVGVLCLEMVLPRRLTAGLHQDDVYSLLRAGQLYTPEISQLVSAPQAMNCEPTWASVILLCLQLNPRRRASLQHLERFVASKLMALESAPNFDRISCHAELQRSACTTGGRETHAAGLRGSVTSRPEVRRHAAPVAAATRLAAVTSCAALLELHASASSSTCVPSATATPTTHAQHAPIPAALKPSAAQHVFAEGRARPRACPADAAQGRVCGASPCMGIRAASVPATLVGKTPLLFSCDLESFDRFTDRPPALSPGNSLSPPTPPPGCTSTQPTHFPPHTARSPPAWMPAHATAACGAAVPPPAPAVDVLDTFPVPLAAAIAAHRHPFGRSPPNSPLPFTCDPVITTPCLADTPRNPGSPRPSADLPILHVDLPRVRTVRSTAASLPDVDDLLPASTAQATPMAPPSTELISPATAIASSRERRCQLSFGKFGAFTPATAAASPRPSLCHLARLVEERLLSARVPEDEEPPAQHSWCSGRALSSRSSASGRVEVEAPQDGASGELGCCSLPRLPATATHGASSLLQAFGSHTPRCRGDEDIHGGRQDVLCAVAWGVGSLSATQLQALEWPSVQCMSSAETDAAHVPRTQRSGPVLRASQELHALP